MIIKALTLGTPDLEATEAFYTGVLNLPLAAKSTTSIVITAGYSSIQFLHVKGSKPFYHFAFRIPRGKVEEAYTWIKERLPVLPFDASTDIADFSNWNAHAFYFHDNNGNILEFIGHHDMPDDTLRPFSTADLIGLCEIGVPVDDVGEACSYFNKVVGVPYFTKGPRLPEFSVMGDELGLLIVTKKGRGWLPTQRPSEQHLTKILMEQNKQSRELVMREGQWSMVNQYR